MGHRKFGGAAGHVVGDEQFPRRVDVHGGIVQVGEGPLVGDAKRPQVGEFVTPEFGPDGVLAGGGKYVDDAAAGGEFAAPGHEVNVFVGFEHQVVGEVGEVVVVADGEGEWVAAGGGFEYGLAHAPGGGHHDAQVCEVVEDFCAGAGHVGGG